MKLDKWQEEVLKAEGNIILSSGRQVGKSTIISIKVGEYAVKNKNKAIMMIAPTERQAYLLFSKTLGYIFDHHKKYIKRGKDRPTKSIIKLENGSIIYCLPTGLDGTGIRGYTIDVLVPDECPLIPESVWPAVVPALATKNGVQWLLGTPKGRQGYFYKCFNDDKFSKFHVSTQEVAEMRDEPMRGYMLDHIKSQKAVMSKVEFTQEYLGEFMEELSQFFPDALISSCMTKLRPGSIKPDKDYYLGVDVARKGRDESVFAVIDRIDRDTFIHVENLITTKTYLTETTDMIIQLEVLYNFKKIYIDDGGIGVAVFDQLLNEPKVKRKVIAINNRARPLDKDENKKKKLLKEDLYMNMLALMEKAKLKLLTDPEIFQSLKSVQYEYSDGGDIRIFGNYTHICEALIRACWCNRDKSLNIWAA